MVLLELEADRRDEMSPAVHRSDPSSVCGSGENKVFCLKVSQSQLVNAPSDLPVQNNVLLAASFTSFRKPAPNLSAENMT